MENIRWRRGISLFIALLLALTVLPLTPEAWAAETLRPQSVGTARAESASYGYFYDQLSPAQQDAYVRAYQACQRADKDAESFTVELDAERYPITQAEWNVAYRAMLEDHYGLYLWVNRRGNHGSANLVTSVELYAYRNNAEFARIEAATTEFLEGVAAADSDYDKVAKIYDNIIHLCHYDYSYSHGGVERMLIGKLGVCDEYAQLFCYLAEKVGLTSIYVYGGSHAWNMVKIDGQWYHVDATWDDEGTVAARDYFLKSTATMLKFHTPSSADPYTKISYPLDAADKDYPLGVSFYGGLQFHVYNFALGFGDATSGSIVTENLIPADYLRIPKGYIIEDWYKDDAYKDKWELYVDQVTADNHIFYAKLTAVPEGSYVVSFDANIPTLYGGAWIKSQIVPAGQSASLPTYPGQTYSLTKWDDTHIFDGWYTDPDGITAWNPSAPVNSDMKVYAKWIEVYRVSFFTSDNSGIDYDFFASQTVRAGESVQMPAETPTRPGYTFAYWTEGRQGTEPWDFSAPVSQNGLQLFAKWIPDQCTVQFDTNGGSDVEKQTVAYGQTAVEPAVPTLEGHTFKGWYIIYGEEGKMYDFSSPVTEDITLHALWNINFYTVNFNTKGGSGNITSIVCYNGAIGEPPAPTRTGYTFGGWHTDQDCTVAYDFATPVTKDFTLYAKWLPNTYTVDFQTNGGGEVAGQTVEYGQTVSEPAAPSKDGYTFGGWYTDEGMSNAYSFSTPVTDHITLYARWLEECHIESGDTLVLRGAWAQESRYTPKLVLSNGVEVEPDQVTWSVVDGLYRTGVEEGGFGFTSSSFTDGDIVDIDPATGAVTVKNSGIVRVRATLISGVTAEMTVVVPGDYNRDGILTLEDVDAVNSLFLGDSELDPQAFSLMLADMDQDGVILPGDVDTINDLFLGNQTIS